VTIALETWTRTTTPARKTGKEYWVLVQQFLKFLFPSSNVMEVSVDSAIDTRSCRLMNFHATPAKLDTITIDDLDDDDFDPRSSTQNNESLDVKPKSTPGLRNPMTTPIIKHQQPVTPQAHPSRILPPPSIPPRDSSKIQIVKDQGQAASSPSLPVARCPFGMNNFDNGVNQQVR
jgi:hypothetical protein